MNHTKPAPDPKKADSTYLDNNNTKGMIQEIQKEYRKVDLTDEIRACLVDRLDRLSERGLSQDRICQAVGLKNKGRMSEIKSGKKKSLPEPVYLALMDL